MGDDFEQTCQKEVDINFAVNKNATKALLCNHLSESMRETEKQIYNKMTQLPWLSLKISNLTGPFSL